MIKKILFITAILLTVWQGVSAAQKIESKKGTVKDGYNFWLAHPSDTAGPKPVVIFLHGASLCGNDLDKVKRYGTIDAIERGREIDAYVISPQNPGGSWSPRKVHEVLEWVKQNHNVDTDRIYVLGMSLGGYGAIDYAATYPDETAAALGMCGGTTVKNIADLNKIPLWIIHGTGDNAVPVQKSDRIVEVMKADDNSAPRLVYDRVPGMNHSQPARMFYLPEVYEWLFAHSLSEPERPLHESPKVNDELMSKAYTGLSGGKSSGSSKKSEASSKKSKNDKKSAKNNKKNNKKNDKKNKKGGKKNTSKQSSKKGKKK